MVALAEAVGRYTEFRQAAFAAEASGAVFPVAPGQTLDALLAQLEPMFFDAAFDPMLTNKTPGKGKDILLSSANNLYGGVSMADLDEFEERYPLNSRLVKRTGRLVEEVYRIGGRYDREISDIVDHLRAAMQVARPATAKALEALVRFYETGEPDDRRGSDIAWVHDVSSTGVGLVYSQTLSVGATITLRLRKSDQSGVILIGAEVIHCTPEVNGSWRIGCRFERALTDDEHDSCL